MKRTLVLVLLGSIAMTGCVTTYQAGAPKGAIDVIAHRGSSTKAPENTLAAFEVAIKDKADWFELDCTLSKDGEVVVIHDDSVDRTTDGEGKVADLTLAEIKKLDAGSWFAPEFAGEKLPTLGEALDLAKDRIGVYIEIKNSADDDKLLNTLMKLADKERIRFTRKQRRQMMQLIEESGTRNLELTRKVIALVRERGMENEIVIQSFTPIVCAVAVEEAPELITELLGSESEDNPGRWPAYLRWCYLIDVKAFNPNYKALTRDLLDSFHRGDRTVAVWTVDEPADMRRFAEWGVDAIITNKPDVCLALLKEMGKR